MRDGVIVGLAAAAVILTVGKLNEKNDKKDVGNGENGGRRARPTPSSTSIQRTMAIPHPVNWTSGIILEEKGSVIFARNCSDSEGCMILW